MTRLFSSLVLSIACAVGAFAQSAQSQPAPGNARTGSARTHQGPGGQVVPGGANPQGQNPPAQAGGVATTQPSGPATAPSYDGACDRFFMMEYYPELRFGEALGEFGIPWMNPDDCDPEWPTAIHTDSACDASRTFVEVRTVNPRAPLCYEFALYAQWRQPDGKVIRVPLASKEVWHEDAGRGHEVGVVYSTLWVHEETDRQMKKEVKKLTIQWARIPFLLQKALGIDEVSLGRTPAAGATVELDFNRTGGYRKLVESPNGWYTVIPLLREGSSSISRPAVQVTSDYSKVNTAVVNAERNRNRVRYGGW